MKKNFVFVVLMVLVFNYSSLKSQTYFFPTVYSPASCMYTYQIDIVMRLDSVQVTNIYFDDGVSNGSFAFKTFFSYDNVFSNSTLPAGNFYTFDLEVYSENPSLSSPEITNNIGTVPLQTDARGGLEAQNNPTYNGSASALGLVQGGVYNSPSLLTTLGFDSAVLHINLPCLDTTITGGKDNRALPVLWSKLTAAVQGNNVWLDWQTYLEENNRGFSIEKSSDGLAWSELGFLPSKAAGGNSSQLLTYRFEETAVHEGIYYYRVVQRDWNGEMMVSNIATLRIGGLPGSELVIYPNPAQTEIYLQYIPANTPYSIFDDHGRIISRGNYLNRIGLQKLSAGLYWIRVGEKISQFVKK